MVTIALIGKSGRADCIADALFRSTRAKRLVALSEARDPGLIAKCEKVKTGKTADTRTVEEFAQAIRPDFAIVGPEEPLAAGVVDALRKIGIPCVGPTQSLARLETSKAFTRELLAKYNIPGNPEYRVFRDLSGIEDYLGEQEGSWLSPTGLRVEEV